jgi:hypothetical protein
VTDETTTQTEEPQPPGVTLFTIWGAFYEAVLVTLIGNTVNKADKQQYRLKAAEVALALTTLETRIRG